MNSHLVSELSKALVSGLTKTAAFPTPGIVRRGIVGIRDSASLPKMVRDSAAGIHKNMAPMNSKNVSDTLTGLGISVGMGIAADRLVKHVTGRMDENERKKKAQAAQ